MQVKEITAYRCQCGRAYFDREKALDCCIEPAKKCCSCGVEIGKSVWMRCKKCRDAETQYGWECAERAAADGDAVLYSEVLDEYLSAGLREFAPNLSPSEFARQFQIYLCKHIVPDPLSLHEWYDEYCFEDQELPGDSQYAEKAIANWIESVNPNEWPQRPTKIAWSGEVKCQ